jgi:probable F420-dependent oxidoreductase
MSNPHPFRFGYIMHAQTPTHAREVARQAEAAGFSTLLADDHLGANLSPLVALAVAAEVTSSLRLGTLVLANDFYNPAILAREIASMDMLCNGRLEFGIGTGYAAADYTQTGIVLDPPRIRVSRFEEALQVVKGALTQTPFSFEGLYYNVRELQTPRSVQQRYPPIMIGGGGKRMLSIAARVANIVGLNGGTSPEGTHDLGSWGPEAFDQRLAWVREAAGTRFDALELNILTWTLIDESPTTAAEKLLGTFGIPPEVLSIEQAQASPKLLLGSTEQIAETLLERRERYGLSYIVFGTLQDGAIGQLEPLVARLTGQ